MDELSVHWIPPLFHRGPRQHFGSVAAQHLLGYPYVAIEGEHVPHHYRVRRTTS